jgi:AcrR family transcriptional regulator
MKRSLQENAAGRDGQRRAALTLRLVDHVLAHGLAGASLRPLAAAAGTSDRMLIYYFGDRATLIAAVLEEVARRMTAVLNAQRASAPLPREVLVARLLPLLFEPAVWPYMQVWLEMASLAARGDADCRRVGESIARGFLAWGAAQIDAPEAERDAEAVRLLMTIEGAVLLKSLGLGADVAALTP